ncbi:putative methylcobalamin:coenzyme M methyltransferase [Proteiniborus sp. DW1]|uniref:uroporphyrinogen decarboxylase family protein n=1 Tax=Proteiniborus sp. DW1 TaxID=1889883 RepID=UPI00092E1CA0|nr:uroporphyrinogen decarboxylase family protein [Proteiniborus sp. DW1]SCG82104.1 putative methylcobalamin:coenzyme M methyltransferase [Proteiniborus sp. DW1]
MTSKNLLKCIGEKVDSIPDSILEDLGLSFEEINNDASKMAILSKSLKRYKNSSHCKIPFCHTVEAEAFGSSVVFDHKYGNRIGGYAIKDINSIDDLKEFDLSRGRIAEVLKAISLLKKDGENVVLDITGPVTLGTGIIDSNVFFRATRKDIGKANKLFELIENSTVEYILESIKNGVDIISYSDPAGSLDIVGPKFFKDFAGKTIYSILKRVEGKLGDSVIHLCIKTSKSLELSGFLEVEETKVEGQSYYEIIKNAKKENKDIEFLGHWCLKSKANKNEIICCKLIP